LSGSFDSFYTTPFPPPLSFPHTVKKIVAILLMYKEIRKEAAAKSYIRKGFLIYEEKCAKI
jgi:hypothetical protein